jgi:hypothetical protein
MKKKWKNVSTDEITWFKPWIVIDLDWNDVLTEKEMSSLAAQLMHIYGAMKRSDRPLKLYLTSLKGKIKDILYKIKGAPNWKVRDTQLSALFHSSNDTVTFVTFSHCVDLNTANERRMSLEGRSGRTRLFATLSKRSVGLFVSRIQ